LLVRGKVGVAVATDAIAAIGITKSSLSPIVTFFARIDLAVATERLRGLDGTGRIAAVAIGIVAVVALLAGVECPVTAVWVGWKGCAAVRAAQVHGTEVVRSTAVAISGLSRRYAGAVAGAAEAILTLVADAVIVADTWGWRQTIFGAVVIRLTPIADAVPAIRGGAIRGT
jgi:hypothetical protein